MININNVITLSCEGEQWVQIPDYPYYFVSNMGRVYNAEKDHFVNGTFNEKGYHIVEFRNEQTPKGKHGKPARVARLVAAAFCKGYSRDKEIHHCNLCRSDDRAENLLPVTHEQHIAIHCAIDRFIKDLLETIACYKAITNSIESEVAA